MASSGKGFVAGVAVSLLATGLYSLALQPKLEESKEEETKKEEETTTNVVQVTLPDWLNEMYESLQDKEYTTKEEMTALSVEISSMNVAKGTGGPFGCAIFERDVATGICKLFSVGCNRVVTLGNSTLHAEMVAIQMAQKKLNTFSMKVAKSEDGSNKEYILCTSCEPCAMCLGGIFWSGVSEMCCAATKDDAESIGFNEGPVFPESYEHLTAEGVKVHKNILRAEGAAVLKRYGEIGEIYNASGTSS